jgi:hypothetical protein
LSRRQWRHRGCPVCAWRSFLGGRGRWSG